MPEDLEEDRSELRDALLGHRPGQGGATEVRVAVGSAGRSTEAKAALAREGGRALTGS